MGLFSTNGHDERGELQREQTEAGLHQQSQATMQQLGSVDEDDFDQLVESGVDQATVSRLRHMLSKDFVLANSIDAEVTEAKWLSRNLVKKLEAVHPPKGSVVQGEYRKFLLDDPGDGLRPISDAKLHEIHQMIMAINSRHTRGRDGWQQEQRSKQTNVSVMEDNRKQSDSKLGAIFR